MAIKLVERSSCMGALGKIERLFLSAGLLLLVIFMLAHVDRAISLRKELQQFRELRRNRTPEKSALVSISERPWVNFNLWSKQRIYGYNISLIHNFAPPLALLRISKIHLEVPVLDGTTELTLNRGVGHIVGTARPGEAGNIGIAGHRDGFFRGLRNVGPGDTLELETEDKTDSYRVEQIAIVDPRNVTVLQPKATRSLTLVTCYPFHFIGNAPKRYVVEASLVNSTAMPQQISQNSDNRARTPIKEATQ
jgi:sortase A